MSIRRLDKSFVPTTRELKYLNKTFPQWKQSFIDYAKVYFPNSYSDFNEASPGMMFIEMAAYLGDVLGFYIDMQFRENLLLYSQERDNILMMAQALGYKPKPSTAAVAVCDFYQLCPAGDASVNYEPDTRFLLKLQPSLVVSAPSFGNVPFRTTELLNFDDPADREITVYALDMSNKPLTYLVKKQSKVVAGEIKTYTATFGTAQKFSKVVLPDDDVLGVISVTDTNGFTWNEVDYLAQDLTFEARENTSPRVVAGEGVAPTYNIRLKRTPRRFVTRYNEEFKLEVQFGSGVLDDSDASIQLDPSKIATSEYQSSLASTALDPSDFLSSRSYGLAPSNVELTITYVTGGGLEANVPSNSISTIQTVELITRRNDFALNEQALFDDVVASLSVNNPAPATGGQGQDSIEEIRQNALAYFNAQNRAVTAQDYIVRAYSMPPKFGGVAKAFVTQDDQINGILRNTNQQAPQGGEFVIDNVGANVVNLYVLGYDQRKKLTRLNLEVKKNLKVYIDQYRLLTDEVRILDAFPVNIGVNFRIVCFKNVNMNEVLARCIDTVKQFFLIEKWQINQPIILNDLALEIAAVEGVQSLMELKIVNKYSFRDGMDYEDYLYDIDSATENGIVYPSLDPCIFEVRYPEKDIVGSAVQ
jgi:hypothetical protein